MSEMIRITIPASLEAIRTPSEELRKLLARQNWSEAACNGCEIAIHELLTNIVRHACSSDPGQMIQVMIRFKDRRMTIQTEDGGVESLIDLESYSLPDPNELKESGYGMGLIKVLMDEVGYRRSSGRNIWTLIKEV
jgi:serine/threonine-protein kinase RsbW